MARKYRRLDPRVWNDEQFSRLDPLSKLIALYLVSGPQSNRCGLYPLSVAAAAEHVLGDCVAPDFNFAERYPNVAVTLAERYANVAATLSERCRNVDPGFRERYAAVLVLLEWEWDPDTRVIWIPTWWRYQLPANQNGFKSCLGDLEDVPQTVLLQRFAENTANLPPTFAELCRNVTGNVTPTLSQRCAPGSGSGSGSGTGDPYVDTCETQESTAADQAAFPDLQIPTRGGGVYTVDADYAAELRTKFPWLDVAAELAKAAAWSEANPAKRKTHRGMRRFLVGWMLAASRAGPTKGGTPPAGGEIDWSFLDE